LAALGFQQKRTDAFDLRFALVPSLVWLIGLALALRRSAPIDRADILRAYATLRLPTV
jgi:hypothetical protein